MRCGSLAPASRQPDLEHVGLDDGADIEPIGLRGGGRGDSPAPVLALPYPRETVVASQRIAAGRGEGDDVVERPAVEAGIWLRRAHLVIELVGEEGHAAGGSEHVLREHVEGAGAGDRRVLRAGIGGIHRRAAFQHLEPVGGDQHGLGGLVEPVVGAADALGEARGALRRTDIDDEVDVAPVDAEVERRGADDRLQAPRRHGVLDLAALAGVERAVVEGDGEVVVIEVPQLLEDVFRLHARVDEDERRPVLADEVVDLLHRMTGGVAGPGQVPFGLQDLELGRRAALGDDEIGRGGCLALRDEPAPQLVRVAHGRRKADGLQARRKRPQPGEAERQKVAALRRHDGMQLVDDDALERGKQRLDLPAGEKQRELLGRRQEDVGGVDLLALALAGRRIAGARLDPDAQAHLGDGQFEIARHVDGERLEGGDVERVEARAPVRRRVGGQFDESRQEPREGLARSRRRDQQHRAPVARLGDELQLVDARRPAAPGEPGGEAAREHKSGIGAGGRGHPAYVVSGARLFEDRDETGNGPAGLEAGRRLVERGDAQADLPAQALMPPALWAKRRSRPIR